MNKATREIVAEKTAKAREIDKSMERVNKAVRNLLVKNGFKDEKSARQAISELLTEKKLSRIEVRSRTDKPRDVTSFYLSFSFDGSVIENMIIRKALKKH